MAGAYAHLTMASFLASRNGLAGLNCLSGKELGPLLQYKKFFELGAVTPDYPYLCILTVAKSSQKNWADLMHYERTGDRLKSAIRYVKSQTGEEKYKLLAWLLGFASHIVTDVTIHPVVKAKVGPYEQNKTAHRICEMSQDVFIYTKTLNVGDIRSNTFLHDGLATCSDPDHKNHIDPSVNRLLHAVFAEIDPKPYQDSPPDCHAWHDHFNGLLMQWAGKKFFFPFARHVAATEYGLVYPKDPLPEFIENLPTPNGGTIHYEALFAKAQEHVKDCWRLILLECLSDQAQDLSSIHNWNLDEGTDERGKITFWE